jgi:hypothetical protein
MTIAEAWPAPGRPFTIARVPSRIDPPRWLTTSAMRAHREPVAGRQAASTAALAGVG